MALTGLEIFKLLPKTNCGACGVAYLPGLCHGLAAGKTDLSKCPYISDEARAKLVEASTPPSPGNHRGGASALKNRRGNRDVPP